MRRVFFAVFVLILFSGCRTLTNTQNMYIGLIDGAICAADGNAVKFYQYDGDGWNVLQGLEFTLPEGYKSVFGVLGEGIGVVIGNTVKIYSYGYFDENDISNGNEEQYLEFTLPSGHENVFVGHYEELVFIGVVVGNTVKFYHLANYDYLNEVRDLEFTLPIEHKSVFGVLDKILVAVGNTVKFYQYDNGWNELQEMEFALPRGSKSVFGGGYNIVSVVVGNAVKFYQYDGDGWNERQEMEFILK